MATSTPKKTQLNTGKGGAPKLAAVAPAAVVTEDGVPLPKPPRADQLKKKELIQRVVTSIGGKKKAGVKEIVEATLTALGEALQKGETLNLPPFGRARIAKAKGEGKNAAMTVKLRGAGEKKTGKGAKDTLADDGEES